MKIFRLSPRKAILTVGVLLSVASLIINHLYLSGKHEQARNFSHKINALNLVIQEQWSNQLHMELTRQNILLSGGRTAEIEKVVQNIPSLSIEEKGKIVKAFGAHDLSKVNTILLAAGDSSVQAINTTFITRTSIEEELADINMHIHGIAVIALYLQALAVLCLLAKDLS